MYFMRKEAQKKPETYILSYKCRSTCYLRNIFPLRMLDFEVKRKLF